MLSNRRVLIVEAEFLIALDIQRILEEVNAEQTVFARSAEEANALADRFAGFDLAIVEIRSDEPRSLGLLHELSEAGVAVVATSAGRRTALPQLTGIPIVYKPFGEIDLLAACVTALATAPTETPPPERGDGAPQS